MNKDLISIYGLTTGDIDTILHTTREIKNLIRQGIPYQPLAGRTLAMIFEKPSTRTRVSFEVGMFQLGGHALCMNPHDMQLGRGETIADTARVLSRYVNGIMIRTFGHDRVEELARWATVPVINGLSDLLHPCQILSDLFTVWEHRGRYRDLTIAYVGDGNNVANSWINAALRVGFDLSLACPPGYEPDRAILDRAQREGSSTITVSHDPYAAVKNADVINTDVWASMGRDKEHAERLEIFNEYQVNQHLLDAAPRDVIVMHCLPAHRGEEITDDVIDGPHSVVWDQAENRNHTQKAIMTLLMAKGEQYGQQT